MLRTNGLKVVLFFVGVFGLAAGLASVHADIEGFDPCCTIPATAHCTEGIGQVYEDGSCHYCFPCDSLCEAASKYGCCPSQLAPNCN